MADHEVAVLKYLDDHRNELLEFTRELVAVPSMNPPGGEQAMADAVLARLSELGLDQTEIRAKAPGRPNIFCRLGNSPSSLTLLLTGHLDTKPVGDRTRWRVDPFGADIVDGQLYGLGSGDMKAALAAMVYATSALRAAQVPLGGNLLLLFTADEEAGSAYGADYLVEEKLVQADAALLGEPCGIRDEWEYICLLSRGNCCFRVKVWGTQMHSSISDILPSVNASSKMAYVLWRMQRDLLSRIRYEPHPLCPQGPTLNVGVMVSGGVFFGVYPGYAEFACDLRTLPGMTREGVAQDIEAFLDELRSEDPSLEVKLEFEPLPLGWIEPCEIPPEHPLVVATQAAAERVFGTCPPLGCIPGTTDSPKLQFGLGIATIPAFGPGRLPLAHSPNEHISVESPLQAAKVYALCALNYLGVV